MLIGEVARHSGVSARMLRHYDALGLVRPTGRTVGGYREYSAEDVRRIFHVESLRSLGLSLKQIGRALDDPAFTPSALVSDLIQWTEDRLAREAELLERLRAIDASAPTGWQDVLRIVELMQGLNSTSAARRQQAVLARPGEVPVPAELLAGAVLAESDPNVAGALRWALARSGGDGVAMLAAGVHSEDVDIRRRAVLAIAAISEAPGATAVLADALGDPDPTVRGQAALALGRRGVTAAVPTLVAMVVEGSNDVEAAEVLGTLSQDPGCADRVTTALADGLAAPTADSATRIRLAQALVELSGTTAGEVLRQLTHDDDRAVALVASSFVGLLEERRRDCHKPGGRLVLSMDSPCLEEHMSGEHAHLPHGVEVIMTLPGAADRIPAGAEARTVRVTLAPGDPGAPPHRHPGPLYGIVTEGEILFELEGEAPRVLKAGDALFEPGGEVIHYQGANNLPDAQSQLVVTMFAPPGTPVLTVVSPEELAERRHLRVTG